MTLTLEPLQLPYALLKLMEVPAVDRAFIGPSSLETSAQELSPFTTVMDGFKRLRTSTSLTPGVDGKAEGQNGERIKDYITQRISARMSGSLDEGIDIQSYFVDAMPTRRDWNRDTFGQPTQDLSSLLNMHFDLNTLQMLNKT